MLKCYCDYCHQSMTDEAMAASRALALEWYNKSLLQNVATEDFCSKCLVHAPGWWTEKYSCMQRSLKTYNNTLRNALKDHYRRKQKLKEVVSAGS
ncbi:hypothetical protein [uncultured Mediterranean phage]|jgi:hypothetical protein|nr:hypothetical protein [uncultured Mediterranean phage]